VQLTFVAHSFVVFCADCFIFSAFTMIVHTVASAKLREPQTLAHFSTVSIFLIAHILVSKSYGLPCSFHSFLQQKEICLFDGCHGCKNHNQLKRTALKLKKKKHMHTGKELEAHKVEKGRLSCDNDMPQVGNAQSDTTGVVKVNRHKTNRLKMRPYHNTFMFLVL